MNKQTLIRTLIVAVPVGVAALVTGYLYRDTGKMPLQGEQQAGTPAGSETAGSATGAGTAADSGQPATTETAATDSADAPAAGSQETAGAAQVPATKPSFDVVGIEPTGETVVAGRSEAGAIVALTANGTVVGKSIANEAGEWTIILNEPLKPGDYDVGLEIHDQSGSLIAGSDERVAVSIPEGGKQQPLVVLNTPDGPSNILQKPDAPEPAAVASAADGTAGEQPAPAEQAATDGQTGETVVAAAEPAQPQQPASESASSTSAQSPAETSAKTPAEPASAETGGTTAQASADSPVAQTASGGSPDNTEAAAAGGEPSDVQATPAEPSQTAGTPEPSGTPAETKTAETQTETGQVAETSKNAAAPSPAETSTADVGGAPSSPAEPSGGETAVAGASEPQNPSAEAATGTASAAENTEPETPSVTVEAVESEKDKVYVAGTGEPGSSVRVYVGDDYQGEAKVDAGGKWLVEGATSVAEGNVEVRADVIGADGSSVDARAAVVFEKEREQQIVLTKVVASGAASGTDGQGASVQKALPVVIIRKGDNLWRISRRLYGDGIRYTTIYQANKGQIRDPDLIYPGQVFLTPEGDLNWPKPAPGTGSNG